MPDEGVALRAVGADSLLARLDGPAGLKALSSAELDQIAGFKARKGSQTTVSVDKQWKSGSGVGRRHQGQGGG